MSLVSLRWPILFSLWLGFLGWSASLLFQFDNAAGEVASNPRQWPDSSPIVPERGSWNLLLVLHPQCSCSRASLAELDAILSAARPRPKVHLIAYRPVNGKETWQDSVPYRAFAGNANATVFEDFDGKESRRFGVKTSGHVLLYDPEGKLRFEGGITQSRGHVGENPGRRAILGLLAENSCEHKSTLVFGCAIHGDFPSTLVTEGGTDVLP
ncbi:MAG: RedB protein [Planctomycetota bacterium]